MALIQIFQVVLKMGFSNNIGYGKELYLIFMLHDDYISTAFPFGPFQMGAAEYVDSGMNTTILYLMCSRYIIRFLLWTFNCLTHYHSVG